jgi:hypothetical protein
MQARRGVQQEQLPVLPGAALAAAARAQVARHAQEAKERTSRALTVARAQQGVIAAELTALGSGASALAARLVSERAAALSARRQRASVRASARARECRAARTRPLAPFFLARRPPRRSNGTPR